MEKFPKAFQRPFILKDFSMRGWSLEATAFGSSVKRVSLKLPYERCILFPSRATFSLGSNALSSHHPLIHSAPNPTRECSPGLSSRPSSQLYPLSSRPLTHSTSFSLPPSLSARKPLVIAIAHSFPAHRRLGSVGYCVFACSCLLCVACVSCS